MNTYIIVSNRRQLVDEMHGLVDHLNPYQIEYELIIFKEQDLIKVGDHMVKFIVKNDHLVSKLYGAKIDKLMVAHGVDLSEYEVEFLRIKTNDISGWGFSPLPPTPTI